MSKKTAARTKKSKTGKPLVPKLRFPEFRECPLYDISLGDVTSESTSRAGHRSARHLVMGVRKDTGIVPMKERLVASDISRYKVVAPNNFAYNPMRLNIGSIARNTHASYVLVSPDYVVFECLTKSDKLGILPSYFDHFRHSEQWHAFVNEAGDGGVRVRVYYKDLAKLHLVVPNLAEQQRIADCLTSLDELIAACSRKLDALKAHKKGLMQNLFPRPGETTPRLRFPEFKNAGEWAEYALGSLSIKVGSGITPKGGDKNYKTHGRIFIRSQNVGWGTLILDDVAYIDEATHRSFDSTEIKKSDVLLNISGASIGRCALADDRIVGGNVNQHVCIIRTKLKKLSPTYLGQYLISQYGQRQIDSFQAGGNRQGLNYSQIKSFSIPCPPQLDEQESISDCLTSLDELIAAQARKIDTLKTHKKGLMQNLFPSLEEET